MFSTILLTIVISSLINYTLLYALAKVVVLTPSTDNGLLGFRVIDIRHLSNDEKVALNNTVYKLVDRNDTDDTGVKDDDSYVVTT